MFSGYDHASEFELLCKDASWAYWMRVEDHEKPLTGVTRYRVEWEEWQGLRDHDLIRERVGEEYPQQPAYQRLMARLYSKKS